MISARRSTWTLNQYIFANLGLIMFLSPDFQESDVTKKKGERVGEHESTIPPDYRFKEQTDPKVSPATNWRKVNN